MRLNTREKRRSSNAALYFFVKWRELILISILSLKSVPSSTRITGFGAISGQFRGNFGAMTSQAIDISDNHSGRGLSPFIQLSQNKLAKSILRWSFILIIFRLSYLEVIGHWLDEYFTIPSNLAPLLSFVDCLCESSRRRRNDCVSPCRRK